MVAETRLDYLNRTLPVSLTIDSNKLPKTEAISSGSRITIETLVKETASIIDIGQSLWNFFQNFDNYSQVKLGIHLNGTTHYITFDRLTNSFSSESDFAERIIVEDLNRITQSKVDQKLS